jgi:hypothetical protein
MLNGPFHTDWTRKSTKCRSSRPISSWPQIINKQPAPFLTAMIAASAVSWFPRSVEKIGGVRRVRTLERLMYHVVSFLMYA